MGCAASSGGGNDAAAPKRWRDRAKKQNEPRSTGTAHDSTVSNLDTSTLSTGLLEDLRQKQRIEEVSANPVKRWIETIAVPSDQDNPDLYDPVRRHRLSMDSVKLQKRKSNGSSQPGPSRDNSDSGAPQSRPQNEAPTDSADPTDHPNGHEASDARSSATGRSQPAPPATEDNVAPPEPTN